MRVEDVPAEWVEAAQAAMWAAGNKPKHMAEALAAVAHLIRAAALEEAAGVADAHASQLKDAAARFARAENDEMTMFTRSKATALDISAAAIRALATKEPTP